MKECPNCEYHKDRAARWRAEAYKQAGHDVIELPWVGLTDEEIVKVLGNVRESITGNVFLHFARAIEATIRSKNT